VADDKDSLWRDLVHIIPGYGAYRAQQSRRDDDRRTREFLAQRLNDCKAALDRLSLQAVAAGDLELPMQLERLRQRIDVVRSRIASAPEGYAGWFGDREVDAELLEKIGQLDASLVSIVDQIDAAARAAGGTDGESAKLDWVQVAELVDRLQGRMDRRNELLRDGV
jgi:hypothetical protein